MKFIFSILLLFNLIDCYSQLVEKLQLVESGEELGKGPYLIGTGLSVPTNENYETYICLKFLNDTSILLENDFLVFNVRKVRGFKKRLKISLKQGQGFSLIDEKEIKVKEGDTILFCIKQDKPRSDSELIIPIRVNVEMRSENFFFIQIYPEINLKCCSRKAGNFKIKLFPYYNLFCIQVDYDAKLYYFKEPFRVDGIAYYFDKFDYRAKTIELHLYSSQEKLFGHKVGYYLDDTNLKKLHKFSKPETKYFLIYYWNPIFGFCADEYKDVKFKSEAFMSEEDAVQVVSIKQLRKNSDLAKLHKNYNPAIQFKQEIVEYDFKDILDENKSIQTALMCDVFQNFVLLSSDGKILNRSLRDFDEFVKYYDKIKDSD